MKIRLKIILSFLIIFSFHTNIIHAGEPNILSGTLHIDKNQNLILNEKKLDYDESLDIIYKDSLGSELISIDKIPENIYANCYLDEKGKIIKILLNEQKKELKQNDKVKKVLTLGKDIYDFKLSHNGKYIAYYSWQDQTLKIKNLMTGKSIWDKELNSNLYDWHPEKNILLFAENESDYFTINTLDLSSLTSDTLLTKEDTHEQSVNFLKYSPSGKEIYFIALKGIPNAHGYTSTVNYLDNKNKVSSLGELPDVNYAVWSPSGNFLAYSQLRQTDIITSIVKLKNLTTDETVIPSSLDKCTLNPIFTLDSKKLIYCDLDGIQQNIILYNLKNKNSNILNKEFRYVDNFCWLDNKTLAYTFGSIPQVKLFNIETQKSDTISEGLAPFTYENKLYFLKRNSKTKETDLFVYQ